MHRDRYHIGHRSLPFTDNVRKIMSTKVKNFFAGILSIVMAVLFFTSSLGIQSIGYSEISASFFPKAIAILLFVLGAVLVIPNCRDTFIWIKRKNFHRTETEKATNISQFIFSHKLAFTMALVIAYCLGIGQVGFLAASIFYLFLQILLLGNSLSKKQILVAIVIAVLVSGIVFGVFRYGFNISLPRGILM